MGFKDYFFHTTKNSLFLKAKEGVCMIFINGSLASKEDREALMSNILYKNLQFTATKDSFGNQYIETFE